MSFEKHSNFNKLANFSEVKFGENKPVLEVELNEMQQIQNEARADIIRDTMPSGFVTLGDIDYDYCANNDNQIKLKTESIAYVNGYRITIPKDTIIEIGESDKVREDLVFLEVWKEAVNDIDTLTEYGGENNAVINNPIKDERYPVATSQRVALKYRIRHVADIDFNKVWVQGNEGADKFIGLNGDGSVFANIIAQGGLEKPYAKPNFRFTFQNQCTKDKDYGIVNRTYRDPGLWSILPDQAVDMAKALNCIDGAVYAIPMFRLLRKPNVGLASPFEYKKIHNQLDPKKFAHLVGQENVEKVHSVNVKGKTYKNLLSTGDVNVVINSTNISNQIGYDNYLLEPPVSGQVYTVAINILKNTLNIGNSIRIVRSETFGVDIRVPKDFTGVYVKSFIADSSEAIEWGTKKHNIYYINVASSGEFVATQHMILQGEYTVDDFKQLFTGVKSLGELDNNSITVENNLVEEGTYVHELQNHILPTHPEVTHVTWGEDVVIPPEVEIELKNGEEVIQTITQLPVKLETTGEEKLHVKTMKGRTLVNLCSDKGYHFGENVWAKIHLNADMVKPNTKYIALVQHIPVNCRWAITNQDGSNVHCPYTVNPFNVFETTDTVSSVLSVHINTINNTVITITKEELEKVKPMIIEYQEGMENWDIPYFEGMQSVKMPVLTTTGKNLYDPNNGRPKNLNFFYNNEQKNELISHNTILSCSVPITKGKKYSLSFSDSVPLKIHKSGQFEDVKSGCTSKVGHHYTEQTITAQMNGYWVIMFCYTEDGVTDNWTQVARDWENELNLMIIEDDTPSSYEPFKSNILSTPSDLELRGIGDVRDDLDLETGEVTECIAEVVLDGSDDEKWKYWNSLTSLVTGFYLDEPLNNTPPYRQLVICDKIPSIETVLSGFNKENIYLSNTGKINLNILNSKATTVDELRIYLSSNPITVQYRLATESIKTVDLTEDDYVCKSKVTYQLAEPLRKVGTYSDFIKGKTLYSNIGVEVLNGSEEWVRNGTNYGFYFNHPNSMPSTPLISPQLPTLNDWGNFDRKGIFRGSEAIGLVVSADDLSENTLQGFKNWLKANPVTIYYVKANPVEIPLKEVSPLDVDFSLNRQFKRGYENYLKELPNGVKDVVENGKVKRNVKHLVVNGTENWTTLSTDGDTVRAFMMLSGAKPLAPTFNSYGFTHGTAQTDMNILGVDQNGNLVIGILKTLLTSPDVQGIKEYLSKKNLHVIYELQTPTTEELTEENSRYVPYMPLNSYVGSLYVADGINQTKFLTAFSPSEYEVQTYHRYFSNEFNVFEDTTLKKSPYGHKTYLEEVEGKYVEKFIAGLEKHEIEDLRHKVSLTGFDYSQLLQDSFLKLIKGELS